ncbi:MAG: hypothetical protein ABJA83_01985 [Burkholderiaceae bacterium]
MRKLSRRPHCLSCVSFDVEAIVEGEPREIELFACFECQDVFYFMPDAPPQLRKLSVFELYPAAGVKG